MIIIIPIDLALGRDHGKGAFREIINLNNIYTSGRNITRIFRIKNIQCKKDNDKILDNTVIDQIGDSLNNIFCGSFIGFKHEDKTQFIILTHGCPLQPPREKTICNAVRPCVFLNWRPSFLHHYPWK